MLYYSQSQDCNNFDFGNLRKTIQKIFEFNKAFCDYYKISKAERKEHRLNLVYKVSERLIEMAAKYTLKNQYLAGQLLTRAFFSKKNILFSRRFQSTLFKFIVGPDISKFIRRVYSAKT